MDLKEFYFQNIKESEYHYRFLESVKKVNYTYNIFYGEEETQNYQFEIYDVEEAITKFKELCQPDVDFSGENKCWFYLITYYLHMLGYEIKEFPRILARPPVDPTDFTYRDIRNRIIALGGDDNGTVRYATRRTFVADLTFEQKSCNIEVNEEKAFQLINEQHLEQLPMHEFLVRIRAQLLWAWARLDEAEASARSGIEVLSSYQPQQQLQCLAMLIQCSLARGDLDNARSQLNRLENLLGNGKYHSDWISNANKVRVIYWQMTGDKAAAANWLRHTAKPEFANNHFLQGQWRNIARAQILLGEFEPAEIVLEELNENARSLRLMSDLNRNLLLLNQLYWQAGRKSDAQRVLLDALKLANRTGFISHFVIEGEAMAQQLRQLIQLNTLPELEQHRAQRILREINQHHRHKFAHFDENFVERLLNHPEVPELIRTSPLTQREWQVLGLIYSGYSNEQIAGELEVAATTIKTHIRNLYQKLGVAHRQDAVQHAQQLLKMMGYGV